MLQIKRRLIKWNNMRRSYAIGANQELYGIVFQHFCRPIFKRNLVSCQRNSIILRECGMNAVNYNKSWSLSFRRLKIGLRKEIESRHKKIWRTLGLQGLEKWNKPNKLLKMEVKLQQIELYKLYKCELQGLWAKLKHLPPRVASPILNPFMK